MLIFPQFSPSQPTNFIRGESKPKLSAILRADSQTPWPAAVTGGFSGVLRDVAYELCAHVVTVSPYGPIGTISAGLFAGEEQHKIFQHFNSVELKPHALFGNIGDEAVSRRNSHAEFGRSQPSETMSWTSAFFLNIQRGHDAGLRVGENTYAAGH